MKTPPPFKVFKTTVGALVVSLFLFNVNMMNKKHQKLNITNKMKLVQI